MKKSLPTILFIFFSLTIFAQENWETYLVKKEKGLMTISVNMDLNLTKPNYNNLLIVGTSTSKCLKNGYPDTEGLEELYVFSDSLALAIDKATKSKLAGIITYQCAGFDVFYVKDTIGLRESIDETIFNNFSQAKNYNVISRDKDWNYYKNSLYPMDLSEDFFMNQDFLRQLVEEGDDLSEPQILKHWIYFNKANNRSKFIDEIKNLNFTIDSVNYKKDKTFLVGQNTIYYNYAKIRSYPYEVKISRKDSIGPATISKLTQLLQVAAKGYKGKYDGWGFE